MGTTTATTTTTTTVMSSMSEGVSVQRDVTGTVVSPTMSTPTMPTTVGIEYETSTIISKTGFAIIQLIPTIFVIGALLTFMILALTRYRQRRNAERRAEGEYLDYYHANRPFSTIYGAKEQNRRATCRRKTVYGLRTSCFSAACNSTTMLIAEISGLYSDATDRDSLDASMISASVDVEMNDAVDVTIHTVPIENSEFPIQEGTMDHTIDTASTPTLQYSTSITSSIASVPCRFKGASLHTLTADDGMKTNTPFEYLHYSEPLRQKRNVLSRSTISYDSFELPTIRSLSESVESHIVHIPDELSNSVEEPDSDGVLQDNHVVIHEIDEPKPVATSVDRNTYMCVYSACGSIEDKPSSLATAMSKEKANEDAETPTNRPGHTLSPIPAATTPVIDGYMDSSVVIAPDEDFPVTLSDRPGISNLYDFTITAMIKIRPKNLERANTYPETNDYFPEANEELSKLLERRERRTSRSFSFDVRMNL